MAEDYFHAIQRVEQRLEIVQAEPKDMEVVREQEPAQAQHDAERQCGKVLQLIEQLETRNCATKNG